MPLAIEAIAFTFYSDFLKHQDISCTATVNPIISLVTVYSCGIV